MNNVQNLIKLGIDLKGRTTGQHKFICPQCSETRRKKNDSCLSVDIDTGLYYCHHCGWKNKVSNSTYTDPIYYLESQRAISKQTFEKYNVSFSGSDIHFNYYQDGKPYNTKVRTKDKDFRFTQSGKESIPYNQDVISSSKELFITEGEIDCLSLIECGFTNAISLGAGANGLKWFESNTLDHVEEFTICTDGDEPGIKARDELIKILGEERTYYITYPKGLKDVNEILTRLGANEVKRAIKNAVPGNKFKRLLSESRITSKTIVETGEMLFSIYDGLEEIPFMRTGNISLLNGKMKSKKTFYLSLLMALAAGNKMDGNHRASVHGSILFFDTEQEAGDSKEIIARIMKMNDLETDPENLIVYNLRPFNVNERIKMIEEAIYSTPDLKLCFIDGIRDLVYDINSPSEATEIATKLLKWSTDSKCHICTILHQNKSDGHSRGHLGTELNNKSETVLSIEKDEKQKNISIVCPEYTRKKEFEPFIIRIESKDGMAVPVFDSDIKPIKEGKKKQKIEPSDYNYTQHDTALKYVFEDEKEVKYSQLISKIQQSWIRQNISFGTTVSKRFKEYYVANEMIIENKEGNGYTYTLNDVPF